MINIFILSLLYTSKLYSLEVLYYYLITIIYIPIFIVNLYIINNNIYKPPYSLLRVANSTINVSITRNLILKCSYTLSFDIIIIT